MQIYPRLPPVVEISWEVKTSLSNKLWKCPIDCPFVCFTRARKRLCNIKSNEEPGLAHSLKKAVQNAIECFWMKGTIQLIKVSYDQVRLKKLFPKPRQILFQGFGDILQNHF